MMPLVLIPARLAATRLPHKPLAMLAGAPLVVHVLRRAEESNVGRVVVAAGDQEIVDVVRAAGGEAVLTDPALPSGTDRIWAALQHIDPQEKYQAIINVQGDLPTLDPRLIQRVYELVQQPQVDMATLVTPFKPHENKEKSQYVKAVVEWQNDQQGRALYFSRACVPWGEGPHDHHIGLYAYRRQALQRFTEQPAGLLEQREKLEQLRALAMGLRIEVGRVNDAPPGVDTPDELEMARKILEGDA
ncbi:MAG: 3-deoxy-manno-octulosonate cytidylyltransferase [Alphaproteobacteria bacterium]|nr:3-deoxy-manno-octulosonate cytidylyltransferase [Alphaproteobacteria bacterium]NDC55803.1 3-deoxy-manno-octulosonate cytidylyltransferase [Alphaproteobacteria bacterium]NDG03811.1 3-deoxy-manno-octulosonate cytidylyltransferase [Alphaproteobacteria bacterium]